MPTNIKTYTDKACESCGEIRPVRTDSKARYCRRCAGKLFPPPRKAGKDSPSWKGGRWINSAGYIVCNIGGKKVLEHRLVAEFNLGRVLSPNEIVHHIDGDKSNNSWGNLRILLRKKHNPGYVLGYQEGFRAGYRRAKEELNEMS